MPAAFLQIPSTTTECFGLQSPGLHIRSDTQRIAHGRIGSGFLTPLREGLDAGDDGDPDDHHAEHEEQKLLLTHNEPPLVWLMDVGSGFRLDRSPGKYRRPFRILKRRGRRALPGRVSSRKPIGAGYTRRASTPVLFPPKARF